MEEKDYIGIIEEKNRTIRILERELKKCRGELATLKEQANEHPKLQESVVTDDKREDAKVESEPDKINIDDCDFSNRITYLLCRAGINNVGQLLRKYPDRKSLLSVHQIGMSTLWTIIRAFEDKGIDMSRYKK